MKSEDQNHECRHCVKSFSSQKALYGHMRLHSDRPWRGMQPPTPAPVDSFPPLPCWIKTAKRGRTSTISTSASSSASSAASSVDPELAANDTLVQPHFKTKKIKKDNLNNQGQLKNVNCPNKLYRCNSCDKEFTSHQALGGHKSGHNKTTTVSGLTERQPSQKRKVLDIDLNELPPMDEEEEAIRFN